MGFDDDREGGGGGWRGPVRATFDFAPDRTFERGHAVCMMARFRDPSVIVMPTTDPWTIPTIAVRLARLEVTQASLDPDAWRLLSCRYREREYTDEERRIKEVADAKLIAHVRNREERAGWKTCEACGQFGCSPPKNAGFFGWYDTPCSTWSPDKQPYVGLNEDEQFKALSHASLKAGEPGNIVIDFPLHPLPQDKVTPLRGLFVPCGTCIFLTIAPQNSTAKPFSAALVGHPA